MQKKKREERYEKTIHAIRLAEEKIRSRFKHLIDKYHLRGLHLSSLLTEVARGIRDEHIAPQVRRCLSVPLEQIFKLLEKNDRAANELESLRQREKDAQEYARHIRSIGKSYEGKFLAAFANLLSEIKTVREDEEALIDILEKCIVSAKRSSQKCERLHQKILTQTRSLTYKLTSIERSIRNSAILSFENAVSIEEEILQITGPLERCLTEFADLEERYHQALEEKNSCYDLLVDIENRETALQHKLNTWLELAKDMEIDVFLALKEDPRNFTADKSQIEECRILWQTHIPPVHTIESSKKILQWRDDLIKMLQSKTLEQTKKPELTVISSRSSSKEEQEKERKGAKKILSPMRFTVCVYCSFCTSRTRLGRTAKVVYRDFLEKNNLTLGFTYEEFLQGLIDAEAKGLMISKTMSSRKNRMNVCWKPTKAGFQAGEKWKTLLPPLPDKKFDQVMKEAQQAKEKERERFIQQVLKRKKTE